MPSCASRIPAFRTRKPWKGGLALATAGGSQYLLVCRYETDNRKLTLRAELYETATSTRAGIAEADGRCRPHAGRRRCTRARRRASRHQLPAARGRGSLRGCPRSRRRGCRRREPRGSPRRAPATRRAAWRSSGRQAAQVRDICRGSSPDPDRSRCRLHRHRASCHRVLRPALPTRGRDPRRGHPVRSMPLQRLGRGLRRVRAPRAARAGPAVQLRQAQGRESSCTRAGARRS